MTFHNESSVAVLSVIAFIGRLSPPSFSAVVLDVDVVVVVVVVLRAQSSGIQVLPRFHSSRMLSRPRSNFRMLAVGVAFFVFVFV